MHFHNLTNGGITVARINVEDRLWFDPRLRGLTKKLGCEFMAIGAVVALWRLAQEQFKHGRLISEDQFRVAQLPEALIECQFAIRTENGIRAKGDKRNFGWLLERKEAGRRGGQKAQSNARAKKRESNKNKDLVQANDKQTQPSFLFPLSSKEKETTTTNTGAPASQTRHRDFIEVYYKSFKKRYGDKARPDMSPKVQGQIKTVLKNLGYERASDLIQAYLQMDDRWFLTKAHDFSTFMGNLQKIALAFDTGKKSASTSVNWDYVFGDDKNAQR